VKLLHDAAGSPVVSRLLEDPYLGEGQASSVGDGFTLYGLVDQGEHHRSFFLFAVAEGYDPLGILLMNRDLCCPGKADLALMILWGQACP